MTTTPETSTPARVIRPSRTWTGNLVRLIREDNVPSQGCRGYVVLDTDYGREYLALDESTRFELIRPACTCGHTSGQHELRSGGLLGCFISGCLCIDFVPVALTNGSAR